LFSFVYSLGLGPPFILAAATFGSAIRAFGFARRHALAVTRIGGLFLVVLGVVQATGLWTPTGAILAHGGFSPNKAFVFDAAGLSWSRVADTAEDRFYATTLSLEDGRIITLFGSASKSFEIYQHGGGWSPPIAVPPEFNIYQFYPWTYLLPDGRLVIAGHQEPARRFNPTAPVADPAETFPTLHGTDRSAGAENGTSVLLPLRPPDYRPRVVVAGATIRRC
jgi:hypothetical protein